MRPVRLSLLCDDQVLVDALAHRLAREPDRFLVERRRGPETHPAGQERTDGLSLVVVDARSVVGHWSVLVDAVTVAEPDVRAVVLADTTDADDAVMAGRRCLAAWIPPDTGADHVVATLRSVADGHTVYPSAVLGVVLRRLADEIRDPGTAGGPLATLTDREHDVLAGLMEGRPGKDIADRLDMAVNTVRTHTSRIFRKLGVHSRLEAVRLAREQGFAPRVVPTPRPTSESRSTDHIRLVPGAAGPNGGPALTRSEYDG